LIRFFTTAPKTTSPIDPRPALYLRVLGARGSDVSFPVLLGKPLYGPLLALRLF
jgi:hypothetical protein